MTVSLITDQGLKRGDFDVVAEILEGVGGRAGSLALPDGRRIPLGAQAASIGRAPDCTVALADPRASRYHAEIRAREWSELLLFDLA